MQKSCELAKSLHKVELIQERTLQFQYYDHKSSYQELLKMSGRGFMHVSRLRDLYVKIHQTMKKLNPYFKQQVFQFKFSMNMNRSMRKPYELQHYKSNQIKFESNTLRFFGPNLWNSLSDDIKSAETMQTFKKS